MKAVLVSTTDDDPITHRSLFHLKLLAWIKQIPYPLMMLWVRFICFSMVPTSHNQKPSQCWIYAIRFSKQAMNFQFSKHSLSSFDQNTVCSELLISCDTMFFVSARAIDNKERRLSLVRKGCPYLWNILSGSCHYSRASLVKLLFFNPNI